MPSSPLAIISRVGGVPRTSVALGYALEVEPYVPGLGLQPHVMNPCNGMISPPAPKTPGNHGRYRHIHLGAYVLAHHVS